MGSLQQSLSDRLHSVHICTSKESPRQASVSLLTTKRYPHQEARCQRLPLNYPVQTPVLKGYTASITRDRGSKIVISAFFILREYALNHIASYLNIGCCPCCASYANRSRQATLHTPYRRINAAFSAAASYRRRPRLCQATYARPHYC
jgi:hypothetical protein